MKRLPKSRNYKRFKFFLNDHLYVGFYNPKKKDLFIGNYSKDCPIVPFPLWVKDFNVSVFYAVLKQNPVIDLAVRILQRLEW